MPHPFTVWRGEPLSEEELAVVRKDFPFMLLFLIAVVVLVAAVLHQGKKQCDENPSACPPQVLIRQ